MQHEVVSTQRLLDKDGNIAEAGWARYPLWLYDRRDVKVSSAFIKETERYTIINDRWAIQLVMGDLGYAGFVSATLTDLRGDSTITSAGFSPKYVTKTVTIPLPMGGMNLSAISSSGSSEYSNKQVHMRFAAQPDRRRIRCIFRNFADGKDLTADLKMKDIDGQSFCAAVPFEGRPKTFCYDQKILCMSVKGLVQLGDVKCIFHYEKDRASYEWQRGVFAPENKWYNAVCSTVINGKNFGFCLGYGLGDREIASSNALIYDKKVHKLENVSFQIQTDDKGEEDYLKPWTVTSDDGRFEAVFIPAIERGLSKDIKAFVSDKHQVMGRITGTAILDDGSEIKMRDELTIIEIIYNKH